MPINRCGTWTNTAHSRDAKRLNISFPVPGPLICSAYKAVSLEWSGFGWYTAPYFLGASSGNTELFFFFFLTQRCEGRVLSCWVVRWNNIITWTVFSSTWVGGNMTSGLCCQVTQSVSGCVTLRTNAGCKCLNKATVLGDKTSRALVSRIRCIFGKLQ